MVHLHSAMILHRGIEQLYNSVMIKELTYIIFNYAYRLHEPSQTLMSLSGQEQEPHQS